MEKALITRKLVEHAVRFLPLLALLLVLTPFLIMRLFPPSSTFESTATLWVSDADQLGGTTLGSENAFASPADRQVRVLNQLMSTDTFAIEVAHAAFLIDDESSAGEISRALFWLRGHVQPGALGGNLLAIKATDPNPEAAQAIASGTVERYLARMSSESERQAQITIDFFKERLAQAEGELQAQQAAFSAYAAANPQSASPDVFDPQYNSLRAELEGRQIVVNSLQTGLQGAELDALTAQQGLKARLSVQDEAPLPTTPVGASTTRTLGYPFIGMLMAAGAAVAYVYISSQADRTVRSTEDFEGLGVPVLGSVSTLRERKRIAGFDLPTFRSPWRRSYARHLAAGLIERDGRSSS